MAHGAGPVPRNLHNTCSRFIHVPWRAHAFAALEDEIQRAGTDCLHKHAHGTIRHGCCQPDTATHLSRVWR